MLELESVPPLLSGFCRLEMSPRLPGSLFSVLTLALEIVEFGSDLSDFIDSIDLSFKSRLLIMEMGFPLEPLFYELFYSQLIYENFLVSSDILNF